MTTEEHIQQLDQDVREIKESLSILIELVTEMNKGLYGDAKNQHVGVIEKQSTMQLEITELKAAIAEIHKKNIEQDISINAKKSVKEDAINWGQKIVGWIIQGIVIYAIIKGVVGADALLK